MKRHISVIGSGSMGTALAIHLANNGKNVRMWSRSKTEVQMINEQREQKEKLPGITVPEGVFCSNDREEVLKNSELVVLAIPAQTIRQNIREMSTYVKKGGVISCFSKGLEEGTGLRLSEVIAQELPEASMVALSGPCHAEELAREIPTAYVAAADDREAAEYVQDIFMSPVFRVYTNTDLIGVELGGALKNVIALCAGISDGLGFGDNTKAALMTRGMAEISRLGEVMGAKRQTFSGLAGIGDLIVTCTSMHSRNRRAGILIGKGKQLKDALEEIKMVVEGVSTARPAFKLSKEKGVTMPIIQEANKILFEGKNPRQAVVDLMTREKKHEHEDIMNGWM